MSKTTDITFCAADFRIAMYLCRPALPRIAITPPHLALTEYNGRAALLAQSLEIEITAPIGNAQPRPAATLCAEAFKGLFASKIGAEDVTIKLPADPAANIEVQLDDCIASFVPAYAEGLPEPTTANGQPHTIRIERKTLISCSLYLGDASSPTCAATGRKAHLMPMVCRASRCVVEIVKLKQPGLDGHRAERWPVIRRLKYRATTKCIDRQRAQQF